MSEFSRWLPVLAPPPGGERRLRLALRPQRTRAHARRWVPLFAVSALVVATAMLLVDRAPTRAQRVEAALLAAWQSPGPALVVRGGAALALPSADPRVRLYLVASQSSNAAPDTGHDVLQDEG